ncbi:hypothetical protein BD408DRAFT_269899 [Parasitella parasitica]|nr:hypothetical protein BD408DRAFT_269899 [Parasitella parasitica]
MTPPRRARKSNTPKKPKSSRVVVEDSSDERSSDADSVTRCICGQGHNSGLMVQCDKCEVWQHCECIGLNQDKLPDHYYCDQCQPENHQIIKTSSGRSKRLYNAGLVSTSTANNTSPSSSSSDKEDRATSTSTKRPTKRRKKAMPAADKTGSNSPKTPLIEAKMEQASPVMNTIEESCMIEERSTRSRRTKISADATEQTRLIPELIKKAPSSPSSPCPTTTATTATKNEKKSTRSKANNRNSSSATPQQQILDDFGSPTIGTACTSSIAPYWNFADGRPTRESSPPAKIKYPNSKMTFSDMNKRAKQIMECIAKMQSEELKRLPPPTMTLKNNSDALLLFDDHSQQLQQSSADAATSFNRPRSLSTCSTSSSLSSASTVPLLDDYATTATSASSSPSTPIPFKDFQQHQQQKQEESSVEILERMSREITKFQRKFGVVYPHYHQHQHGIISNGSVGHAKASTGSK